MNSEHNRAVWFDIPVSDLQRAAAFYAAVLNLKVDLQESDGTIIGVLDWSGGNSGCLLLKPDEIRADSGILLYLNVNNRIRDAVRKAQDFGGKIIQRIHSIPPHGYRVVLLDSEGNRIALHSTADS